MKKIMLTTLLLLMVVLSSCGVVQDYLPGCLSSCDGDQNETNTSVVFDDSYEFTGEEEDTVDEDVEVIDVIVAPTDEDDVEVLDNETVVDDSVLDNETVVDELAPVEEEVLTSIEAIEGDLISLADLIAQDPDGDVIVYTYTEPLSADGDWKTQDGDEGTYVVTVTASDGLLSTSEKIKLIVGPSNKGPVIDCPSSLRVDEGAVVELPCTIYDKEGDKVTFTVTGYADDLTFETSFEDAGVKTIFVKANDGNKETIKTITLTIADVNRAPVVEEVSEITALEGETIELDIVATDADKDELEITYPLLFDEDGVWVTVKGDAGTYELEAIVSDGDSQVVVPIDMIVGKVNSAPTLSLESTIEVAEGEMIDLEISASDIDGDDLEVTISGFMDVETYQTTYDDAGEYETVVSVSDGKTSVSKTVKIIVSDVNRPPVFVIN